jgi:hypothetical protein
MSDGWPAGRLDARGGAAGPGEAPAGHPAAFHDGPGHVIRWANPLFLAMFGQAVVGLPAREAMTGFGSAGFELMDRVRREGRPLARPVATPAGRYRLVVVPRRDIETGETYGVTTHLRIPAER